jgi:hypothetical protein
VLIDTLSWATKAPNVPEAVKDFLCSDFSATANESKLLLISTFGFLGSWRKIRTFFDVNVRIFGQLAENPNFIRFNVRIFGELAKNPNFQSNE